MKLAFCLFNYFPYGGLQRDFLRIARACQERGHEIHVYTMQWEGSAEPWLQVHLIKVWTWQNHARANKFANMIESQLKQYDLVIGFNKMPHLDLYYAADVCYQARIHAGKSWFYRLLPRYRQWQALEKVVFARGNQTEIMLISALQEKEFRKYYDTEPERFHLLPPGIAKDRIAPVNASDIRYAMRKSHQIAENDFLLLMLGSGFKTKGVDRAVIALAALPSALRARCHLFVIGQDDPKPFATLAARLQVGTQVNFLGGRSDVPDFLLAADLLLHPAYHENTGTVLLEALVAGLPVLTVEACGYAHYIREANAGVVLAAPFHQNALNDALQKMLSSAEMTRWHQNALEFAKHADLYSLPEKAADLIEQVGLKRVSTS
jgi:UDP-glucose:(heptosyl)LPS alpha-1,3-glucosyltransferase